MSGFRRDDGQSSLEWIGVAAVVVALVVVLMSLAPGMGENVADAWRCLLDRVGAGDGCAPSAVVDGGPQTPCVLSSETTNAEVGVKVVIVEVDGRYGYVVEERSDGTVEVTEVVRVEGGAATGVGGGVAVNLGDQRIGERAGVGGRAAGFIELGDSWVFPDRGEADEHIENTLVDRALDSNPITSLPGVNQVAGGVLGLVGVGGNDVEGEREARRVEVGALAHGIAEAVGGIASTELSAGLEESVGMSVHPDGRVDATFGITAEAAGSLGMPALADVDLGAGGAAELTVSFGPEGGIDRVGLTVTGTTTQDSGVRSEDPRQAVEDLVTSVVDPQDATRQVVIDHQLDIDSPQLRQATIAFITSLAPGGTAAGDGADELGEALLGSSTTTMSVYELDEGRYGIDASGEYIVGGRLSVNLVREGATLVEASYVDPATGAFTPWINCTG